MKKKFIIALLIFTITTGNSFATTSTNNSNYYISKTEKAKYEKKIEDYLDNYDKSLTSLSNKEKSEIYLKLYQKISSVPKQDFSVLKKEIYETLKYLLDKKYNEYWNLYLKDVDTIPSLFLDDQLNSDLMKKFEKKLDDEKTEIKSYATYKDFSSKSCFIDGTCNIYKVIWYSEEDLSPISSNLDSKDINSNWIKVKNGYIAPENLYGGVKQYMFRDNSYGAYCDMTDDEIMSNPYSRTISYNMWIVDTATTDCSDPTYKAIQLSNYRIIKEIMKGPTEENKAYYNQLIEDYNFGISYFRDGGLVNKEGGINNKVYDYLPKDKFLILEPTGFDENIKRVSYSDSTFGYYFDNYAGIMKYDPKYNRFKDDFHHFPYIKGDYKNGFTIY